MAREKLEMVLIEDDEEDFILTKKQLAQIDNWDLKLDWVSNYEEARKTLLNQNYDVYFVDLNLGHQNGLDLVKECAGELLVMKPVIILTGKRNPELDVVSIQKGASDYLVKGETSPEMLERSIRYSLERYYATCKLFEKEQRFKLLFEQSFSAHFLLDENGNFIEFNRSAADFFGLENKMIGKVSFNKFFKDDSEFEKLIDGMKQLERLNNLEMKIINKKGEERLCSLSCGKLEDTEGNKVGLQVVLTDITQQAQEKQELIIAEKHAMTGRLTRIIAHEVRNPLSNVNLALGQIKDNNKFPIELTSYAEIIENNAKRIDELITQLLDSSRPTELVKRPADLREVLRASYQNVRDRAELLDIKTEIKFPDQCPKLNLDTPQLILAFTNLLMNGLEAIDHDNGIIRMELFCDSGSWLVSISDNGCGMKDVQKQHLFEPFYTSKRNGTGLGMTACRNVLQAHEASIMIDSSVGKGTTVRVEFNGGE